MTPPTTPDDVHAGAVAALALLTASVAERPPVDAIVGMVADHDADDLVAGTLLLARLLARDLAHREGVEVPEVLAALGRYLAEQELQL